MKRNHLIFFGIVALIFLLDQAIKYCIRSKIALGGSVLVIPNIFHLTNFKNTGAGFSILQDQTLILIFISLMVVGYILFSLDKIMQRKPLFQYLVALVLGGALGNLYDRIVFGYVTDFLDFQVWPVFNIADSALSIGILGIIVYLWKYD